MTSADLEACREEKFHSAIRFAQVRSAKRERARREKHLPSELFAEPAWDILLELYSFQLVGRLVSEPELTDRLTAPTTVVTRWMKMLEARNLIARAVAPPDVTVRVKLTRLGLASMDGYFSELD